MGIIESKYKFTPECDTCIQKSCSQCLKKSEEKQVKQVKKPGKITGGRRKLKKGRKKSKKKYLK